MKTLVDSYSGSPRLAVYVPTPLGALLPELLLDPASHPTLTL